MNTIYSPVQESNSQLHSHKLDTLTTEPRATVNSDDVKSLA